MLANIEAPEWERFGAWEHGSLRRGDDSLLMLGSRARRIVDVQLPEGDR